MIAVRGLEMPKNCESCQFLAHRTRICKACGDRISYLGASDGRDEKCPLMDLGLMDKTFNTTVVNEEDGQC